MHGKESFKIADCLRLLSFLHCSFSGRNKTLVLLLFLELPGALGTSLIAT